jgi:isochorismate synthase
MFSDVMKRAEAQLSNKLPFVVYSKPNSNEVRAIFQKNDELHFTKDYMEKGFVFAPFDSDGSAVLLHLDEQLVADFKPEEDAKSIQGRSVDADPGQRQFHLNLVKKGIGQIEKGTFGKVVLSRKFEMDCSQPPLSLLKRVLEIYTSAFCYLWYHPKVGMWLGATPEILLRVDNNRLTTISLAGTQAITDNDGPNWSQKEHIEQEMVTDYITQALQDKVSQIKKSEVQSVKAGNLWHLRTKITALLHNNLTMIVKALHPTPAVCGIPMQAAKDFVLEHENYDREYYTGFLGELNLKKEIGRSTHNRNWEHKSYHFIKSTTELFVNLRCMQLKDDRAIIYVGGGITSGSNPEEEWEETIAKSSTMLGVLTKSEYLL